MKKMFIILWVPILMFALLFSWGCSQKAPAPEPSKPAETTKAPEETETPEASPSPEMTEDDDQPIVSSVFVRRSRKDPFSPVVGRPIPGQPDLLPPETAVVDTPETPAGPPAGTPVAPTTGGPVAVKTGAPVPVRPSAPKASPQPVMIDGAQAGISVSGIVKAGASYRAILSSSGGASYVVTRGQKVGEWTVASIDPRTVILTGKGYKAKISLSEDMEGPGLKGKKGKGVTPPKTVEGPKIPDGGSGAVTTAPAKSGEVPPPPPPPQ